MDLENPTLFYHRERRMVKLECECKMWLTESWSFGGNIGDAGRDCNMWGKTGASGIIEMRKILHFCYNPNPECNTNNTILWHDTVKSKALSK